MNNADTITLYSYLSIWIGLVLRVSGIIDDGYAFTFAIAGAILGILVIKYRKTRLTIV